MPPIKKPISFFFLILAFLFFLNHVTVEAGKQHSLDAQNTTYNQEKPSIHLTPQIWEFPELSKSCGGVITHSRASQCIITKILLWGIKVVPYITQIALFHQEGRAPSRVCVHTSEWVMLPYLQVWCRSSWAEFRAPASPCTWHQVPLAGGWAGGDRLVEPRLGTFLNPKEQLKQLKLRVFPTGRKGTFLLVNFLASAL